MAAQNDVFSIVDWPDHRQLNDLSIPAWFEQRAAAQPDDLAVASDAVRYTYGELDAAANRLAFSILARGGALGDRIAILARHDSLLLAVILAILKTGRVVIVLNPGDPVLRLNQLVSSVGASQIVVDKTHEELANALFANTGSILCADDHVSGPDVGPPGISVSPDQLAFLIFTSGSTGEPKGVTRTHRQALQLAVQTSLLIEARRDDRVASILALSSEVGITTALISLLMGSSLHPFPIAEKGITQLESWLQDQAITVVSITASIFRQFVALLADGTLFPSVRALQLGSEEVTSQDFRDFQKHFSKGCALLHTLGCSEVGIILQRRLSWQDAVEAGTLPFTGSAHGIDIFLVDEVGEEVPTGTLGEIIVKGKSLSNGYWGDPVQTEKRFIEWPPGSKDRAYKTGDLARAEANGLISFVGRLDTQIKICGYRVELSEVEQAICRLVGVQQAVATFARINRQPEIAAHVVLKPGTTKSPVELRQELASLLPRQMIPARILLLDQIPITPTGKVDREQLRKMQQIRSERDSTLLPESDTELALARFWADVLEVPSVRRNEDFFELGGDSLKATIVAAWVHDAFEVDIHLGTFADHPILHELAAAIDEIRLKGSQVPLPPLLQAPREGPFPLSVSQEHIWIASQTDAGMKAHTATEMRKITGRLDRDLLRACMGRLAERHDMLRTVFPTTSGQTTQVVLPPAPFQLPFLDLTGETDPTREALRRYDSEQSKTINLGNGPLVRVTLIKIAADEHWLISTYHHILTDPWSWDVYYRELDQLYAAGSRGATTELPPISIQYRDFAAWQRNILRDDSPVYEAAVQNWATLLSGVPRLLNLPFTRQRPKADADPMEGIIQWALEREVDQRLDVLEEVSGTSYFTIRLAAFVAALAAESGQPAFVIGTYLTHRNRIALQNVFGPFVYLVGLSFHVDLGKSFREWLSTVWQIATAAQGNSPIPLDRLNEGLDRLGISPTVVRTIFNAVRSNSPARLGDLEMTQIAAKASGMHQGFQIYTEQNTRTWGALFDARVYDPGKVKQFVERYRRLLEAASADPDAPMERFLTNKEARGLTKVWQRLIGMRG